MRLVAAALGPWHDAVTTLDAEAMTARLGDADVILETRGAALCTHPVPEEWRTVARAYRKVVVVISAEPMPGGLRAPVRPMPPFTMWVAITGLVGQAKGTRSGSGPGPTRREG